MCIRDSGSPEVTTGGRALKFYASVRIDVRKGETIKNGSDLIGNRTKIKVVKNKMAPPFREAEFDILFGEGISREGSILDVATTLGIVKRSGTWFSYNDLRLGQGRDNARTYLKENKDVCNEIDQAVRESLHNSNHKTTAETTGDDDHPGETANASTDTPDLDDLLGLDEI